MESLVFSLQATIPVFLLIALGWLLGRSGLLREEFCAVSDKLVFQIALPVLLFCDLAETELRGNFDAGYLLFCAGVTTVIFFTLWAAARRLVPDKSLVGEFVQLSYRSSAAILGCAIIRGIYGNVGMAPLMILGSVPLFNIYAVLVLTMEHPDIAEKRLGERLRAALLGVAKNPIIIGILLGLLVSYFGVGTLPPIADNVLGSIAALATPLALLSIGASFRGRKALSSIKLSSAAAGIKLLLLPALFLPLAVVCGFEGSKLLALIIMLGSTSTPTCYIMAKNLGHEGSLSVSVIVLTTLCAGFTLTFWIFLFRHLGYLA